MQLGFISMKMLKKTFSATSQIWLHILPGNSCSRPLDLNCSLHRVSFIIIILWIQILKSFGRFTCIPCVNHQLCLKLSFGESVAVVVELEPKRDILVNRIMKKNFSTCSLRHRISSDLCLD